MACLYGLLKVDRTASADALRRAFYALAKKTHPDKRPGDAEAAEHFRTLKKAYDVLRDPARRARYDKTGHSGDEELFGTAAQYYDKVDISTEDIDQFTSEYLGSEAEVADVLAYVRQNLGDVSRILESIIGSGDGDAARLAAVARAAFDAEEQTPATASLEDEGVDLNSEDGDDEEDDDEEGDDEEGDEEDDDEEEEGDCDDGEDAANDVAEDEKPTPSKRAKAAPVDADAGLLAMFAARQGAREAGFSAFESKWAAKASKASLPKAPKAAAQPKAQKPPQPPKAKARR